MNWKPGQLVKTAAFLKMKSAMVGVASKNRALALLGARGGGLSFMAKNLQATATTIGISGKVAYVEFFAEEETATALRRIAIAVGGDPSKIPFVAGVSQLFDRIVESVTSNGVHLLIVDNTHFLSSETLSLIGHLTSRTPRIQGLAVLPAQLTLFYDRKNPTPTESFLGVLFLTVGFDKDQVQGLTDSCDWRGIDPLPLLSFEEMVALLVGLDYRFTQIVETAQQNRESEEFLLLQYMYRVSAGVFARFERIIFRFDLSGTEPLDIHDLHEAVQDYVQCQSLPKLSPVKAARL